ncbi:CGNR zinc finger domain-containing protein [Acidicapsa ligni]|uniref:CGNR zinc finger domain-containing protein n=1 Tax=Acidicapsa ligni TaxID=542300 RepID=UPI0021E08945|nr:ABATE domain-containing protein [Acidicapsa ligni]
MSSQTSQATGNEPTLWGDHPALDFLNTVVKIDGELTDSLQSDRDVLQWIIHFGWLSEKAANELARPLRSSLLKTARSLRSTIRTLVEQRKAGKRPDPQALNEFLAHARTYLKLSIQQDGSLQVERKWKHKTAEELLAPLAESAADLMANADFNLVRRCEDTECVLWFYDRTKSHHRRWCSMAACGNRNKVAAFRKRQQQAS